MSGLRRTPGHQVLPLGPFDLHAAAGHGAMGEVWRGVHRARQHPVAIKIMTSTSARGQSYRALFGREVRAVARLDHPGIIRLHDHGTIPEALGLLTHQRLPVGAPWLAMDWLDGGPLSAARGSLRWPELRQTLLALLDALAHAHARGLVHRDFKDGNVLMGEAGPVIADFGLAVDPTALDPSDERRIAGTPYFMAPELVRGDSRAVGPWTDLYALGCVAFALCTGAPPFAGRAPIPVMQAQATARRPTVHPCHPVPDGLTDWILRCMAIDPRERYRFAADAAFDLMRLVDPIADAAGSKAPSAPDPDDPAARTLWTAPAFVAVDESAWVEAEPADGAPPMPMGWRRPTGALPRPPALAGAGRALVGLREPRLRGRHAERTSLWDTLRTVIEGNGPGLALIHGSSGVGKSRLARWLGFRAHEVGAAMSITATHSENPEPGSGVGPMLDRVLRCGGLTDALRVARVRRSLGLAPNDADAVRLAAATCPTGRCAIEETSISPASADERIAAWVEIVRLISSRRTLLIVVDDAQWADDETFELIDSVIARGAPARILFVLTVRDDVGRTPARSRLANLTAHPGAASIALGPLDARALDRVIDDWLPLEPRTAERVRRRASGSPMFAAELILHWVRTDALESTAAGYRLRRARWHAVPDGIVGLWQTRIDGAVTGAEPSAFEALEAAAVLGMAPDTEEWAAVCEGAGLPVPRTALERLVDARLLVDDDEGWRFSHVMAREALIGRARLGGRLGRWHGLCADAPGMAARPSERAHHLMGAERPIEAIPLLIDAGWRAWRASADRRAQRLVIRAARAAWQARLPSGDRLRAEIRALWSLCGRGSGHRTHGHARRAVDGADGCPPSLRARLLFAWAYAATGGNDAAVIRARFDAALAAAETAADAFLIVRCHRWRAVSAVRRGAFDDATRALDAAEDVLAALGGPMTAEGAYLLARRAEVAASAGDLPRAWTLGQSARARFVKLGHRGGLGMIARQLAEVARARGEQLVAHRLLLDARRIWRDLGRDQAIRLVDLNLGLLLNEMGRFDEAFRRLRAVRSGRCPVHYDVLACLLLLAPDAHRQDWASWDAHWARIAPLREGRVVEPDVAVAARLAARGAALAGQDARAEAAWRLALDQYRRLGRLRDVADVRAERTHTPTQPLSPTPKG